MVVPLVATLAVAACATGSGTARGGANVRAAEEAERRYQAAMALFRDESWPEASEAFRAIQQQNATSRHATLAELRLADIEFKQDRFTEALAAYRAWLRYHPTHADAPYVRFMVGRCHLAQMPEDWFLTPPSYERDLSAAHDAETAFARFMRDHADSEHAGEARRLLTEIRATLARHELYVADFYRTRSRYEAAASRLLGVLANFHDSGLEPAALLQLGEVYLRMNRQADARGAFRSLTEEYARSAEADAARRHLARLGPGPARAPRPEELRAASDGGDGVVDVTTPASEAAPTRQQ